MVEILWIITAQLFVGAKGKVLSNAGGEGEERTEGEEGERGEGGRAGRAGPSH